MSKKILIIDDNAQDTKIMTRFLNQEGYDDIVTASKGEEGIQKTEKEKPALVILDTLLPDLNGFAVCQKIKQEKKLPVKVIVLTGVVDAVDAGKARESGADEYVVKTSDYSSLISTVNVLLKAGATA